MGAKDLRKEAHAAFEKKYEQLISGDLTPIQQRVKTIVDRGQTEAFAEATHLSVSRVEKIARGTQHAPDNENKRELFMQQLTVFEQNLGLMAEAAHPETATLG